MDVNNFGRFFLSNDLEGRSGPSPTVTMLLRSFGRYLNATPIPSPTEQSPTVVYTVSQHSYAK